MKALLFLLLPLAASARFTLRGVVADAITNTPMPGVNLSIRTGGSLVITHANGVFTIVWHKPSESMVFSLLGYLCAKKTSGTGRSIP